MPHIEWNEQLLVGHEKMDRLHRQLIDTMNAVLDALDNSDLVLFEENIELLHQRAHSHIEFEECLMRESGYEEAEAHERDHRASVAQLDVFNTVMGQGLIAHGRGSIAFLSEWLLGHINVFDRPLADHLRQLDSIERRHSSDGV